MRHQIMLMAREVSKVDGDLNRQFLVRHREQTLPIRRLPQQFLNGPDVIR